MKQNYPEAFKEKNSATARGSGTHVPKPHRRIWYIKNWCREYSRECCEKAGAVPEEPNELEVMKENLRLRQELEEARKENAFLKNEEVRYNCTILDLFDRSAVASTTDRNITHPHPPKGPESPVGYGRPYPPQRPGLSVHFSGFY